MDKEMMYWCDFCLFKVGFNQLINWQPLKLWKQPFLKKAKVKKQAKFPKIKLRLQATHIKME